MSYEEMRKAFESYLRTKYACEGEKENPWFLLVHGDVANSYVYTQHEWEAWQSAIAHSCAGAAPPRGPLTLVEIAKVLADVGADPDQPGEWHLEFVRRVEAAHGVNPSPRRGGNE
jgi:hypothetical protein